MADRPISPAGESFSRELRRVLQHLYDWVELSKSPFLALFDLKQRHDPPEALRDILRKAIEALKPVAKVSPKSKVWRTYQILYTRYMEQFTQKEVAAELGVSIRHLRREESLAVQTLAAYLWDRYDLAPRWEPLTARLLHPGDPQAQPDITTPTSEQELGWVQTSLPSQPVSVAKTVEAALKLITPLAQASQVQIDSRIPPNLPGWIIQVTPVQQALLIILTFAVSRAPQGKIALRARVDGPKIRLRIEAVAPHPVDYGGEGELERLAMARQLLELSGGTLEFVKIDPLSFAIRIALPAEEPISILVIDDNVDTLQLLERYLSNSRYRFIGTADPHQVLPLALESCPQVIVLDVMLPEVDGWEILGRFQQHPQTHHIPLIVCSILPQEELALNLGAAAFIRKPVSRPDFLSVLDRVLAPPLKASG